MKNKNLKTYFIYYINNLGIHGKTQKVCENPKQAAFLFRANNPFCSIKRIAEQ